MFVGRKLIIATKHKKENVIAPLFRKAFEVECFVDPFFDTDSLGTFTGEIERKEDPVTTLRQKCLLAMESNGCDLGIASEGSFGPHPSFFFMPSDDELMIFIDKKNNLEILARNLSTSTNFNGKYITNEKELIQFAASVVFPSHALIIQKDKNDFSFIQKGIHDKKELLNQFNFCLENFNGAYVETDMRAMHNPMRMQVIEEVTVQLIEKIQSKCPACSTLGFSIGELIAGLPCEWCGYPTSSIRYRRYVCAKCDYTEDKLHPNGKKFEEPMYCNICNP